MRQFVTITRVFHRLCEKSGLGEDVKIHSLRHGFSTYLAEAGLNAIADKFDPALKKASGENQETDSDVTEDKNDAALKKASGEN